MTDTQRKEVFSPVSDALMDHVREMNTLITDRIDRELKVENEQPPLNPLSVESMVKQLKEQYPKRENPLESPQAGYMYFSGISRRRLFNRIFKIYEVKND